MHILNRLPLTASALALVIAFSALKVGVRQIKRIFRPNNTANIAAILPLEMQQEIIRHIFDPLNANDSELLNLSLTCKHWNKFISENPAWLTERLDYQARKIEIEFNADRDVEDPTILSPQRIDLLGTDQVLSPKIAYFFITKRYYPRGEHSFTYSRFSSDLKRYKDDQLYVPWINHNLLQRPRTFWQFLKTILIAPEWLGPFLVCRTDLKTARKDEQNRRRMYPIVVVCSIVFSFFPYLDSLLFRPDALVSQIKQFMASENGLHYLLWEMKPWSLATFLRASLNLMPLQFFENSLAIDDGPLFIIRLGLIALLSLLSIGPMVRQLIMAGSGLLVYLLIPRIPSKDIKLLLGACYFASWLFYFGPVQALVFLASVVAFIVDLRLTQIPKAKSALRLTEARYRFVFHLLLLLSNLL